MKAAVMFNIATTCVNGVSPAATRCLKMCILSKALFINSHRDLGCSGRNNRQKNRGMRKLSLPESKVDLTLFSFYSP